MRRIQRPGSHTVEVRRSRFTCTLARVDDEAAAVAFLTAHRRAHRDATHNCTAYVVGDRGETTRSSDDGEPAGTAGIPMLEVLLRRRVTGTAAVVTRHFGGVKLGAGGLARAYAGVVAATLDLVGLVELLPVTDVTVRVAHTDAGRFLGDLHARGPAPQTVRYGADVAVTVGVPAADTAEFAAWAAAVTGGRAAVEHGPTRYGEVPLPP
ncbi:IMPACT family protein [Actinomadura rayongensis]|uniref:IMPACT family protein n=1 Tax=Actinomadura rayongensis TaxID=1429076 RepID=A0A6I4WG32_9ACTN|nr:YigZ family protein [Actinomadura rayongensis]MXQ67285.1 IMPACT family protein [Actinomadura rayongensis]